MKNRRGIFKHCGLLALGTALLLGSILGPVQEVQAQFNFEPNGRPQLRIDISRSIYADDDSDWIDVSHGVLEGSVNIGMLLPLGYNVSLQLNVPLARSVGTYQWQGWTGTEREEYESYGAGNPYIGVAIRADDPGITFRFGVHPGLIADRDPALLVGTRNERPHSSESYYYKTTSLKTNIEYNNSRASVTPLGVFGASFLVPHEEDEDVELTLAYGAGIRVQNDRAFGDLKVLGWMLATEGDLTFAQASFHFISFGGGLRLSAVTPTLEVRVPTEKDMRKFVTATIVAGITYSF